MSKKSHFNTNNHAREETGLNNFNKDPKNLDTSPEKKEEELMYFLLAKNLEIERISSKIHSTLQLNKKELDFYFMANVMSNGSHKDTVEEGFKEIEGIRNEVSAVLKNYLKPLNDEEKYHVAEIMNEKGLMDFVMLNLRDFGKVFNKKLAEQYIDHFGRNKYISDEVAKALVEEWRNSLQTGMTINDGDRQRIDDESFNLNDNWISDAGVLKMAKNSKVDGDELVRRWVKLCDPEDVRRSLKGHKDESGLDDEKINEIVKQLYKDKYGIDEEELNKNLGIFLREHYRDRTGLTYNEKQQVFKEHKDESGSGDQ